MNRIALTFIGRDRPGIIAGVSQVLCDTGCNIEDATMTILEGEFAMILITTVPAGVNGKLWSGFDQLREKWGLQYFSKPLSGKRSRGEKHPAGTQSYVLSVMGHDRTGIVYETSRILAKKKLNVTDLNSKILGSRKKPVFAMILEVDIPTGFDLKRLEPSWKRLRSRWGVDITLKPVDRLTL